MYLWPNQLCLQAIRMFYYHMAHVVFYIYTASVFVSCKLYNLPLESLYCFVQNVYINWLFFASTLCHTSERSLILEIHKLHNSLYYHTLRRGTLNEKRIESNLGCLDRQKAGIIIYAIGFVLKELMDPL